MIRLLLDRLFGRFGWYQRWRQAGTGSAVPGSLGLVRVLVGHRCPLCREARYVDIDKGLGPEVCRGVADPAADNFMAYFYLCPDCGHHNLKRGDRDDSPSRVPRFSLRYTFCAKCDHEFDIVTVFSGRADSDGTPEGTVFEGIVFHCLVRPEPAGDGDGFLNTSR